MIPGSTGPVGARGPAWEGGEPLRGLGAGVPAGKVARNHITRSLPGNFFFATKSSTPNLPGNTFFSRQVPPPTAYPAAPPHHAPSPATTHLPGNILFPATKSHHRQPTRQCWILTKSPATTHLPGQHRPQRSAIRPAPKSQHQHQEPTRSQRSRRMSYHAWPTRQFSFFRPTKSQHQWTYPAARVAYNPLVPRARSLPGC